jgi:hypothetical protein
MVVVKGVVGDLSDEELFIGGTGSGMFGYL